MSDQRAGEGDALSFAAGQLRGTTREQVAAPDQSAASRTRAPMSPLGTFLATSPKPMLSPTFRCGNRA